MPAPVFRKTDGPINTLINDWAVVPLVDAGEKYAQARWLSEENVAHGSFELPQWNIANRP